MLLSLSVEKRYLDQASSLNRLLLSVTDQKSTNFDHKNYGNFFVTLHFVMLVFKDVMKDLGVAWSLSLE